MAAYKNLRWKILTIVAVVILFAAVGVYPLVAPRFGLPTPAWLMAKQLQLGLDLKGGVHLVMRVNRDDALRITTERAGEQLREALTTAGISVGTINVTSPTSFRVEGVPQDKDVEFRRIAEEQTATNYERSSGVGGAYDFTMRPNIARGLREQTMIAGAGHHRSPRERVRRHRTQHRHARRRRRSAAGAAARRHRRRAGQEPHPVAGPPRDQARRRRPGAEP